MINPVAVASVLVYVIAASVALYFIYLFIFAGLNRKERARLLVCFILLVSAAFFWSAFEQKPTSFNLFANDYTNRMIGDFEIPAVWFQSINALFIILLAPVFQLGMAEAGEQKHSSEQHHQVRDRYSVCSGGLWPDDAGGAERTEQWWGRGFSVLAGGQYPDADARGTVPESDWSGDHDPAGAGKNARPDDGPVVLRQCAG